MYLAGFGGVSKGELGRGECAVVSGSAGRGWILLVARESKVDAVALVGAACHDRRLHVLNKGCNQLETTTLVGGLALGWRVRGQSTC